jgi:ABC-type transport system involved in multi-copper enzyme maturation permease subunit
MSATGALPAAAAPRRRPSTGGVTQLGVLRSEWTKLWSLRSTRWSLLFALVTMAGLGPLIAVVTMGRWGRLSLHEHLTFDPINTALGGYHLAQLAIGVLGVLVISGEYSTGQIRSTFMAVPRRLPVLWAKAATFATVTFVLTLLASLIAFFVAQAILTRHHVNVSIDHAPALRAVIGAGLYMVVLGVFALSLGALVRNTAGGIAIFAGVLFVLPGLAHVLPASTFNAINPYLPSNAGADVLSNTTDPGMLAPWTGFAVFCAYAVVAFLASALLLVRRDA